MMLHVLLCVNDLLRNSPEERDKELYQIHEVTVLGESNLKRKRNRCVNGDNNIHFHVCVNTCV